MICVKWDLFSIEGARISVEHMRDTLGSQLIRCVWRTGAGGRCVPSAASADEVEDPRQLKFCHAQHMDSPRGSRIDSHSGEFASGTSLLG